MNMARRVWSLTCNGMRCRRLKKSGQPYRIEAISLEITHRCFCRCCMCNIWEIPAQVPDLGLAEWLELLSSPELQHLKELDLTGGEPFLRNDLDALLQGICDLQPTHFPELRTVAITTNGILTGRILEITREISDRLRFRGIDLVLACGMDAVGELHDRIRNFPGAWARLQKTLAGLSDLTKHHPNLILGIKTTVVPLNADQLDRIANFAEEHGLFTIISPRIITANRFKNMGKSAELSFTPEQLAAMARFYAGPRFAWSGHRQTLLEFLKVGRVRKPCSAGFNTLFVRHSGDVFPCPVLTRALGTIKEQPLGELFRSPLADTFRKDVGRIPECAVCTEPGLERIAWAFEGFTLLKLLTRNGFKNFGRFIEHTGVDKYL